MAGPSAIRAGRAFVELFADDSMLIRTLRRAEARVVRFGENIKAIGRRLTTLGLAASVPFAASMKVFSDFDDQMRFVKSTTQATGEEFDRLTEKAKFLGRTTSFTASQVAGAMAELGLAGFSVDEIDNATQSMLDLARATRTDLAESAEIAANTLRAFSIPAKDMERVGDVLVATATNSATKLTDLGEAMSYAAPLAKQYGMTLEQTAKALGSLSNFGIKGSMAGTTLRRLITNFSDSNVQKKLSRIDVSVVDQDTGKMREVSEVLRDIGAATQELPTSQKLGFFKQIFGLWAIAGGASLTTASFDKLIEAVDNSAGAGRRAAKEMDAGIGGSLRMMWSAVEGVAIAVGEALAPALQKLTDWLTAATSGMVDYITKNKQIIIQAAKAVAAITGIGVGLIAAGTAIVVVGKVIGVIATIISGVAGGVMMLFGFITGAASLASFAFSLVGPAIAAILSPIGLAIAGIVALSAVAVLLLRNTELLQSVFGAVSEAVSVFSGMLSDALGRIGESVQWLGQQFVKLFRFATETFEGIVSALGRGDIEAAFNLISATINLIWAKACENVLGTWYWLSDTLLGAWNSILGFWNDNVYRMQLIWSEFSSGIVSAWKTAEKTIAKGIGYIIAKMEGLDPDQLAATIEEDYNREAQKRTQDKLSNQSRIDEDYRAQKTKLASDREMQKTLYGVRVKSLEDAANAAREAYQDALNAAKNPAPGQNQESIIEKLGAKLEEVFSGGAISAQIEKTRSAGTFSAFAINSLAETNYAKITADAATEQVRLLEKLNDKLDEE